MGNKSAKASTKLSEDSKKFWNHLVPIPGRPSLTEKDYEFFQLQTALTRDDIKKIFDEFYDANSDGKLNREQFIKLYCSFREEPRELLEKICEQIFYCFDSNNDNYIDFYEFMLGYAITSRGDPRKKLEYAFYLYDRDKNEFIDENEVIKITTGMHVLLGFDKENVDIDLFVDDCITTLDVSKDGKISKEEFINGLMKNYSLRIQMMPFH